VGLASLNSLNIIADKNFHFYSEQFFDIILLCKMSVSNWLFFALWWRYLNRTNNDLPYFIHAFKAKNL